MKRLASFTYPLFLLAAILALSVVAPSSHAQTTPGIGTQYPPGVSSYAGKLAYDLIAFSNATTDAAITADWDNAKPARDRMNVSLDDSLKKADSNWVDCAARADAAATAAGLAAMSTEVYRQTLRQLQCVCTASYMAELDGILSWLKGGGRQQTFASFDSAVVDEVSNFYNAADGAYAGARDAGSGPEELTALWNAFQDFYFALWARADKLETDFVNALDKNVVGPYRDRGKTSQAYFNCQQSVPGAATAACSP